MNSLKKLALALTAALSVGLARGSAQVSLRGIYTTAVNGTLTAVIAVHDNNNLDAFLFDKGQMEVGKGKATIDSSGNFTLAGVIGYGVAGTLTATGASASISGQVTNPTWSQPAAYTAPRTVFFGANNSGGISIINGRFTGKVSSANAAGMTNITLIVDANNNLYVIHEYATGAYTGGIGTVTPDSTDDGGTFTFTSVKGVVVNGTFSISGPFKRGKNCDQ